MATSLPPAFLRELCELEAAYLLQDDPIRQSGFGGGAARWRVERGPILEAVDGDGTLLDVGCANGYLLECLVAWARDRGIRLEPFGLDQGPGLIELARERFSDRPLDFFCANAWTWQPPRRFHYVYTMNDIVPPDYLEAYLKRLLQQFVEPGGRLIVGAYGSRSRGLPPFDVQGYLRSIGLPVAGTARGGEPPLTAFAWVGV